MSKLTGNPTGRPRVDFTGMQADLDRLIAAKRSRREIAAALGVGLGTLSRHLRENGVTTLGKCRPHPGHKITQEHRARLNAACGTPAYKAKRLAQRRRHTPQEAEKKRTAMLAVWARKKAAERGPYRGITSREGLSSQIGRRSVGI